MGWKCVRDGERQREERRWGEGLVCVRNRGERGGECVRWGREKKEEGRDVRVRKCGKEKRKEKRKREGERRDRVVQKKRGKKRR
jgi:hypothetical protein